jgi:GNAT superfamily N-acetyltransferase
LIAAGWAADLVLGGGLVHAFAWLGAAVVVVGADAWTVRAARRLRSVTLTASELRVGDDSVPRGQITAVVPEVQLSVRILGRRTGEGLPRGVHGLTLQLADGELVTIPVRASDELVAALGLDHEVPEIRVAEPSEYDQLVDVERRADQLFTLSGIGPLPEPGTVEDLAAARVVLVAGRPAVGFARIEQVDSIAHLELLAVIPRAMRKGVGTALVQACCEWARAHGYPAITLTTFADVAWNAPFYARLGFLQVAEVDVTPGLAELRDWERDLGLDALGTRVVMRRNL